MNKAIHGAVRRDLDRFVAALDAFTPGDRSRAARLHAAWVNFDDQLSVHHHGEHDIAWPALQAVGVDAGTLATMDAEHATMAAALTDTRAAMEALERTAAATDRDAALAAMTKLQSVTVEHLDHEEAETEDVYLAKRDTPEIRAMGKEFGKVSPARGGRFLAWVLDGASPEERAAVTDSVPGPVLSIVGGIFGRGYRKSIAPTWRQ